MNAIYFSVRFLPLISPTAMKSYRSWMHAKLISHHVFFHFLFVLSFDYIRAHATEVVYILIFHGKKYAPPVKLHIASNTSDTCISESIFPMVIADFDYVVCSHALPKDNASDVLDFSPSKSINLI